MFNSGVESKISPFARKYQRFLDGTMTSQEDEEKEQFEGFIQRLMGEELEEGETNPIKYGSMPFFHCELTGLQRVSFSTADDPFYKTTVSKYYPEAVVFNSEGEVLTRIDPSN